MKVFDNSWRTFAVRTAVFSVAVFGAMRLAVARDGVAGGPARSYVTVAGTATGVQGERAQMRFTFHRRDSVAPLCAPTVDVPVNRSNGSFVAQIPLDDPDAGLLCPSNLFDGSDTVVDVAVNGMLVAPNVAINPVPYAHYATTAGTPLCPARYACETTAEMGWTCDPTVADDLSRGFKVRCVRKRADGFAYDEVVRVGIGNSAFWIDRYEASVWTTQTATIGTQIFQTDRDFSTVQFPRNGQGSGPAYALSVVNVVPANSITWFQANEACAASGKMLPTGSQWLRAARETTDPPTPESGDSGCRTSNLDPRFTNRPRTTGLGMMTCRSHWGAQDMIGNLWEWTGEWTSDQNAMSASGSWADPIYASDGVGGSGRRFYNNDFSMSSPLPGVALRGGSYSDGAAAGVFAVSYSHSPATWNVNLGFRCVVSR